MYGAVASPRIPSNLFCFYMSLITELKKFYKTHRRDLPWRHTHDPYKILVSEMMLQQTQVERVVPKYQAFVKAFPTAQALAAAPLSQVLLLWQGLGYNRRAKYLWESAKILSATKSSDVGSRGRVHLSRRQNGFVELPPKLPGVGPYTRAAVEAFAFNTPGVFVETNIRTVFTRAYFPHREGVHDAELMPLIERDLKRSKMEPREFYAALMDYGSYLKRQGVRINSKSKHYTKQKKFVGSDRQKRGALLRELVVSPQTEAQLVKKLSYTKKEAARLLARLTDEGLLTKVGSLYRVAD